MKRAALHMEHMWTNFPEEILVSNVLPRLPMASLCRFRAVCKTWNALLTQSDFAAQHALVSPVEEFVFVSLQFFLPANSLGGWDVLDVANSRVVSLSHDLFATSSRCGGIPNQERKILAANGGLLFVWYGNLRDHSLLICNPALKTVKVIPSLEEWDFRNRYGGKAMSMNTVSSVVMSTDTISMEYKIVVFHPMEGHYQNYCIDVFESKTSKWRRVMNRSMLSLSLGSWCRSSKFVKFKNAIYRLYITEDNWKPCLIEFDKTNGVGSIVNFVEPFLNDKECNPEYDRSSLELVVSQDRLFCVYRQKVEEELEDGEYINHMFMEIFELFPKQHEWESFVKMPEVLRHWLDGNDVNLELPWSVELHYRRGPLVPIGCASSILFCSGVGRFVAYDLADKSWYQFSHSCPLNSLEPESWSSVGLSLAIDCSNFGLSLCPP